MIIWDIDWRSPYEAFAPLSGEPYAHLLHGGDQSGAADWSIIVAFPESLVCASDGKSDGDPFSILQECVSARAHTSDGQPQGLPFLSGLIGYAGYEAARHAEPTVDMPSSPFALPDLAFGVYDAAALFSRRRRRAYITGRDERACLRLKNALGKDPLPLDVPIEFGALSSNFSPTGYEEAVHNAIEDILDGDYYQVNIAHQISALADAGIDSFNLYRRLAGKSDAFFGALLQFPDGAILSNSPERFFNVSSAAAGARRILSEPIKGTRPRGDTPATDEALMDELLRDPKDRAENVMIADLVRNDLSKICRDGSIREAEICTLLSLTNVHHLVSRISGDLRNEVTMEDIFKALFPCGSITGAPKIAAMNAIAKTEKIGRGPYCGAIGYIDDRGIADFAVAIRTMIVTQNKQRLTIPVGGGITLRSHPRREYEETIVKASAALRAIGKSQRDLV